MFLKSDIKNKGVVTYKRKKNPDAQGGKEVREGLQKHPSLFSFIKEKPTQV